MSLHCPSNSCLVLAQYTIFRPFTQCVPERSLITKSKSMCRSISPALASRLKTPQLNTCSTPLCQKLRCQLSFCSHDTIECHTRLVFSCVAVEEAPEGLAPLYKDLVYMWPRRARQATYWTKHFLIHTISNRLPVSIESTFSFQ